MRSIRREPIWLNDLYQVILFLGLGALLYIGPSLKDLEDDHLIFYPIKYGLICLLLGLGIYFFYAKQIKNYLKLTFFIPFTIDYQLHLAFIILTIVLFNKKLLLPFRSPLNSIYIFFLWGILSYIINQFIEFNPLSFPLFVFTFFIQFIFFSLFLVNADNIQDELLNFFLNLVSLTIGLITIQSVLQPAIHPDFWNGGTANAHIAAAYISIGFVICVLSLRGTSRLSLNNSLREIVLAVFSLPILFLIDAKYFLILLVIILPGYFIFTGGKKLKIAAAAFVILVMSILSISILKEKPLPLSILTFKLENYNFNTLSNSFKNSPKYQLLKSAFKLPFEEPLTFFLGSGPGTFLSRASFLQFSIGNKINSSSINNGREKIPYTSKYAVKSTWIRKKYAPNSFEENVDPGSLFNRRSGLISIYYEMGVIGLGLFIFIYFSIIKPALSTKPLLNKKYNVFIIPLAILFVTINYFSYWNEYWNFCIIQYGILGILLAGEGNYVNKDRVQ